MVRMLADPPCTGSVYVTWNAARQPRLFVMSVAVLAQYCSHIFGVPCRLSVRANDLRCQVTL